MTSLEAGRAYARYDLDISGLRRSVQEAKGLYRQLKQEAQAAAQQSRGGAGSGQSSADRQRLQQIAAIERALKQQAAAERALIREQRSVADSAVRAARAEQDYARALQIVDRELARTAQNTARYNNLLAQRAQLERQMGRGGGGGGGLTLGGFGQTVAAVGLGTVGPQLIGQGIQAGIGAGQEALALRETQNALKAVAGDYQTYGKVVRVAREQQLLFGGSLRENIEGLSGLTITSRSTGASLEGLIDLSQRLGVLSPEQGAAGARIALAEGLAEGNITSLSRRFEIPRQALERLKDTSLPVEERLQAISDHLDKVGITSAAVAGRVDQDALAYRRLSQELADLGTNAGDKLASNFASAADGLSLLIGAVNDNPAAIAELKSIFSGRPATNEDLQRETDAVNRAKAQRSLVVDQRGAGQLQARVGGREELESLIDRVAEIQAVGGPAARAVDNLNEAFFIGTIQLPQYLQQLAELERQVQAGEVATDASTKAADDAKRAQEEQNAAIVEAIQKKQEQTELDQQQTDISAALEEAAFRVATGQSTQAAEVARLTALYPGLAGEIEGLIDKQILLASKTDEASAALGRQAGQERLDAQQAQTRDSSGSIGFDSPGRSGTDDVGAVVAEIERQKQEQAKAEADARAARDRLTDLTETSQQQVNRTRKAEADALARFGKDSAEYLNAQYERIQAEQQLATEQERASAKSGKASNSQAKAAATAFDQIENRAEDHARKMLQIQEDYQRDARRSQEDFELGRSRDQEDFERQRRRLLAEGKIFEAAMLTEEFERERAREQQDFDRERQRAAEDQAGKVERESLDAGIDTARIADRAARRGISIPGQIPSVDTAVGGPAPAVGPVPPATFAPGGAGGSAIRLQLQIAPTRVEIDGQQVAIIEWPYIEQMIGAEMGDQLINIQVSDPPATTNPLSGPRP